MAAELKHLIPILTDTVAAPADASPPASEQTGEDRESLIAELQTQLAASTFALTEDVMRSAFAEMEASIFQQITGRLRRELPEMIDILLRERLGHDEEF